MPKQPHQCIVCQCQLTKSEAQFIDEDSFSFLAKLPTGVLPGSYFPSCFDGHVKTEIGRYNELMERAKNVNVFFASQGKESRFVRRSERPIQVEGCADRAEAILRLAFRAVE